MIWSSDFVVEPTKVAIARHVPHFNRDAFHYSADSADAGNKLERRGIGNEIRHNLRLRDVHRIARRHLDHLRPRPALPWRAEPAPESSGFPCPGINSAFDFQSGIVPSRL